MLQVLSNDRVKAPEHRVRRIRRGIERYSAPFFFNPSYEAVISSIFGVEENIRYRPINWGEFRRIRFQGDYANVGKEIQIEDFRILQNADGSNQEL